MKILLDECVTKKLIPFLKDHEVSTVSQMKWNGLKNGELISKVEQAGFEMLLTIDKKIKYQQNISKYNIIIVIINTSSSSIESLSEYIPNLNKAIGSFEKGNFYFIEL